METTKSRIIFIPRWHYENWIGEATGWHEALEYDLYFLQFYNWDEDGVNVYINGIPEHVDIISNHLINSMTDAENTFDCNY
jgi:hypothetical protein